MTDEETTDIQVSCDCGFTVHGNADDVVAATQQHGRTVHNMDVTREQVMAMSSPAS